MENKQLNKGQVVHVDACRLAVAAARWGYAEAYAAEITAHWRQSVARSPRYFNGVIQILTEHCITGGVFTGTFATTDFAGFLYWRGQGYPGAVGRNCFGCAILRSAAGHLLLGVQAAGNLNTGRAYCPGGFIDPADVAADGTIDIDRSVAREFAEETGLAVSDLKRSPGYVLTGSRSSIAIGIVYRSALNADRLRDAILCHLARQAEPELADILIVRQPSDLDGVKTSAYVPALVRALL
jgi:hypothetical protein